MSTQMGADTRGLLCLPSKPAWLELASASCRARMSYLATWGEIKHARTRQGIIFKPSTAWTSWLLDEAGLCPLGLESKRGAHICLHPSMQACPYMPVFMFTKYLFIWPPTNGSIFMTAFRNCTAFCFTISLYCTKPKYCGVHNNQQKSGIEAYMIMTAINSNKLITFVKCFCFW